MFQKLITYSIRHKLVVGVFTIALIIWGIVSLIHLPFDSTPDITDNQVHKSLDFQILHECLNTLWDGSEVVVVHLLVLCRIVTHQGATCQHQVWTCSIQAFIYQEVLLLPT